ncbi:uncharacterized protein LOC119554179 [Drosophila subpulchrella]|uniref:uncharacterized protein LOC119554179 n=1 Tax=Drosophila subpulchrella TaxID=1486046 RepID=UPI0018A1352B|nr:uncharacterized protein LOC119554179 [Drosophila subpulchrella]
MENPRTITDLPYEILDLIFKNLVYLKYKVNLSQAHEKLGKAFAFHCRNKFRSLSPGAQLTAELWAILIQECGPTIEEYVYGDSGYSWNDLIAEAVVTHCPNLKSVSIRLFMSGQVGVPAFLKKLKSTLKSVKIDQQDYFPATVLAVVGEMTQLQTLSFKGYVDENVHHVEKCIALEKLSIEHVSHWEKPPVNLLRICASLRNLRVLSLNKIKIMPFEEPHSNMWVGLKTLTLDFCEFSEGLPDCPELKKLDIHYPRCHTEGYSFKFILKNGRNLHTLYEKCEPPIDAEGFLQLLRSCPKLRYLYTRMEFIKLYSAYVSRIIAILETNGVTREDPLELVICRRIKWKWFKRLLLRTPNAELIDLYEGTG